MEKQLVFCKREITDLGTSGAGTAFSSSKDYFLFPFVSPNLRSLSLMFGIRTVDVFSLTLDYPPNVRFKATFLFLVQST